jgi:hypothetical protein
MMMDSTFPENHAMWRAVNSPVMHKAFYVGIIAWEAATMLLCWWGAVELARALRGRAAVFEAAKRSAIAGLTLSKADVAAGISKHRRRVVSDVAIENLEWARNGIPDVHRGWNDFAGADTARGGGGVPGLRTFGSQDGSKREASVLERMKGKTVPLRNQRVRQPNAILN